MELLEILKTIILGIVEGITEWLPISSTGHLILVDEFIKLNVTEEFKEMFDVVIQLGAILAVVMLNLNKLWPFAFTEKRKRKFDVKGNIIMDIMTLWFKVLVASIPAGVIGILLDDWIDAHFFNATTVAITLIVYGILFIVIENYNKGRKPKVTEFAQLTYRDAFFIGAFQMLALIPGTSRSGATILGALLIGLSRYVAAEFSFYLAIPAMCGASVIKVLKYVKDGGVFNMEQTVLLAVGMVTAYVVSVLAIKFLMGYIKKNDFKVFGWYRIVLGILVILYFTLVG